MANGRRFYVSKFVFSVNQASVQRGAENILFFPESHGLLAILPDLQSAICLQKQFGFNLFAVSGLMHGVRFVFFQLWCVIEVLNSAGDPYWPIMSISTYGDCPKLRTFHLIAIRFLGGHVRKRLPQTHVLN